VRRAIEAGFRESRDAADPVGRNRPLVNQVLQRLVAHGIVEVGRGNVVVTNLAELRRKVRA
jgi:DNA-binding IscR family transcriptional regulator